MEKAPLKLDQPPASRWRLIRDLIAFQFKLILDALRDLLLSPISIIATIAGLLTNNKNPGKYFYRLMALGHKSDRWINLFDHHESNEQDIHSADSFLRHAENIVLKEYEKGGVVSNLKNRTDQVFDSMGQTDAQRKSTSAHQPDDTTKPQL